MRAVAVGALLAVSATACVARPHPTTSITVYAASSLITSFTAIGKDFEAANPGYSVEFIFASTPNLSTALADGAAADVFASGDPGSMAVVADAGAVSGIPEPFASNRLVVVTPSGNPAASDLVRRPRPTRPAGGGVRDGGGVRSGNSARRRSER